MGFDMRKEYHADAEWKAVPLMRRAAKRLRGFMGRFREAIEGKVGFVGPRSDLHADPRGESAEIARLRSELEAHARLIREQEDSLAHSRKIFRRASEAARIGVWECSLADETIVWTDGVYDIFEIPRGAPLDRQQTLTCYPEESRRRLVAVRSKAIAERSGFTLDTEIITMKGNRRWMRITATIECEDGVPVRIFGMKQDITEEKILADRTRYLAEFDTMTGLSNRASFQSRLSEIDGRKEGGSGSIGALLLVDLDGFKQVNDTFGHACGDACLKEAANRLTEVSGEAELIARIGGDEFAVLLPEGVDESRIKRIAGTIVDALNRPIVEIEGAHNFGASVGIARNDGCSSEQLFNRADAALYAAKASGRNTYRLFPELAAQA